eukprot:GGOE01014641.1.p1 GENE.GGOE01014641.1~~GGOE01014641.1.p1  ORF type:complete len:342 (+),score=80.39 GGOE01014641.1:66-1091(+)
MSSSGLRTGWLCLVLLSVSLFQLHESSIANQTVLPALIVNHHNELRWRWMKHLTAQVGLKPIRSQSYNWANKSARVPAAVIFGSLRPPEQQVMPHLMSDAWRAAMVTLSHRKAWQEVGADPSMAEDDWALFFEDDCNITRKANLSSVNQIIRTALQTAERRNQSFIYFGIEGNAACNTSIAAPELVLGKFFYFPHCYGKGAHSYALQKRSARHFWEVLRAHRFAHPCVCVRKRHCARRASQRSHGTSLCCHNVTLAPTHWAPDVRFGNDWGPDSWMQPYCAYHGCPVVDLKKGVTESIFFQERMKFPTQVWWDPKGSSRAKPPRLFPSGNTTSPARPPRRG